MTNLDIEGASAPGTRLEEDYFQGLSLTWFSTWLDGDNEANAWTAAGPGTPSKFNDHGGRDDSWLGRMDVAASIRTHASWGACGWRDAVRFREMGHLVTSSPHIRKAIIKGLCLSLGVTLIIFFFEMAFYPDQLFFDEEDAHHVHHVQTWAEGDEVLWLYPLVAISYFVASSWTNDVAKAATRLKHGRGMSVSAALGGMTSSSFRYRILSQSFRVLIILNYVAVGLSLRHIPWIGHLLCFFLISCVDAYYCFEPVMIGRGWSLERRLRYVESRWAYMTVFGLLPTVVSYFHPSGLLNLFLFMTIYPFYVVLALLARPEPRSMTGGSILTPVSGASDTFPSDIRSSDGTSLASFLPARIPIFLPTVVLYRLIMRLAPRPEDKEFMGMGGRGLYGGEKSPAYSSFATGDGSRRTAAQFVDGAWGGLGTPTSRFGSTQPIWGPTNGASAATIWSQQQQTHLPPPPPPPPYPYVHPVAIDSQLMDVTGEFAPSAEPSVQLVHPAHLAAPPMSMSGEARSRSGSAAAGTGTGTGTGTSINTGGSLGLSTSTSSRIGSQRHVHYHEGGGMMMTITPPDESHSNHNHHNNNAARAGDLSGRSGQTGPTTLPPPPPPPPPSTATTTATTSTTSTTQPKRNGIGPTMVSIGKKSD